MKALILAAGFGKRLLPFSKYMPKPLFPIGGRPNLDLIIQNLIDAGCKAIIINTHYLHKDIDSFINTQKYSIPVATRYEPVILGTGGAIKNAADFWDDQPFIVINSDIVTDIDLRKVYDFHLSHHYPVTLVLNDHYKFNNVSVNREDFIVGFYDSTITPGVSSSQEIKNKDTGSDYIKKLAFTGIQVLDPGILSFIPDNRFSSSIDIYQGLLFSGNKIKASVLNNNYWKDIGTCESYKEAVFDKMAPDAFKHKWSAHSKKKISSVKLKGDGSDRIWYRLSSEDRSIVMSDHGIKKSDGVSEIDSFAAIGRHLHSKGINVPEIISYDSFSGLTFMEDLGDVDLMTVVSRSGNFDEITSFYRSVINLMIKMSVAGVKDFDLSWAYQTPHYNKDLVFEKECRYFFDAFLIGYLNLDLSFQDLKNDFIHLSNRAVEFATDGFMHRDLQSRNIMVKKNKFYFIDFQGGRIGPIQYDLASLLIDPYVNLPSFIQAELLNYAVKKVKSSIHIDPDKFRTCFRYCRITRNLQILGAFGYLSKVKGKTFFEKYIPAAVKTLKHNLLIFDNGEFPSLKAIVKNIQEEQKREPDKSDGKWLAGQYGGDNCKAYSD